MSHIAIDIGSGHRPMTTQPRRTGPYLDETTKEI